ncbi:MAG TPA: carboxypeptidase-like regulatory domain-containing protein [Thermoanaerobaculia bacterium]|nr:carboxypeptidase-like regulatory domain-containing protein [Thermoanaerobaculia bacterium]
MASRNEKLDRLKITSPCTASWDAMSDEGERRYCAQCNRHVLDFARMTPRQIEARVTAASGRFCARMTRSKDGSLVTLPAPELPSSWIERRVSPVATALVTALLGLGSAAAEAASREPIATSAVPAPVSSDRSQPSPTSAPGAGLTGVVLDESGQTIPGFGITIRDPDGRELSTTTGAEGRFSFENLKAGAYDLTGSLEGFEPVSSPKTLVRDGATTSVEIRSQFAAEETITVGGSGPPPLRWAFEESDLIVVGIVGASRAIDAVDSPEMETELRVTSVIRGRSSVRRSLLVDRVVDWKSDRLAPGTQVLAFLKPGEPRPGRKEVYATTDWAYGVKVVTDAEVAAYEDRFGELKRLEHREPQPADLAEWLVATVVEPSTREGETRELWTALASVEEAARKGGVPVEQAAESLRASVARRRTEGKPFGKDEAFDRAGAFVTEAERQRLSRALLATRTLTRGDLELYEIVRPWAGDEAVEWLADRFRKAEPLDGDVGRDAMGRLAEELGSGSLEALLREGDAKSNAFFESLPPKAMDDPQSYQADFSALEKELRDRFREMLGK